MEPTKCPRCGEAPPDPGDLKFYAKLVPLACGLCRKELKEIDDHARDIIREENRVAPRGSW